MCHQRYWIVVFAVALVLGPNEIRAQLTELALYHLGEEDPNAGPGQPVVRAVESLEGRDMETFGQLFYSDDTPPGISSSLSVAFDGEIDNYLFTDAVPWHSFYPGFRVGMEAWIKVDPELQGVETVPFGDGTGYFLSIDPDGFPVAHAFSVTPPGVTPIRYGEWEHVAFWTTGTFWQVYVNGEPQFPAGELPQFNYGSPTGLATIGADKDGTFEFKGLIDEYRIFTWTGPFNPAELLFFTQRNEGDVNEDGLVNQSDYDIWRMNVGADLSGKTLLEGRGMGDLDGDRQIDLDDFAAIKANKSPGAALNVPEPASWPLLALGLVAILRYRRE